MPMSIENRKKAGERLAKARAARRNVTIVSDFRTGEVLQIDGRESTTIHPPAQAIISQTPYEKPSPNDPRLAKLRGIQARTWASGNGRADGEKNAEALARHEAERAGIEPVADLISQERIVITPEPPKPTMIEVPMKPPFRITGSQSGLCISELGPCVCGEPKLKWHAICLKVKASV